MQTRERKPSHRTVSALSMCLLSFTRATPELPPPPSCGLVATPRFVLILNAKKAELRACHARPANGPAHGRGGGESDRSDAEGDDGSDDDAAPFYAPPPPPASSSAWSLQLRPSPGKVSRKEKRARADAEAAAEEAAHRGGGGRGPGWPFSSFYSLCLELVSANGIPFLKLYGATCLFCAIFSFCKIHRRDALERRPRPYRRFPARSRGGHPGSEVLRARAPLDARPARLPRAAGCGRRPGLCFRRRRRLFGFRLGASEPSPSRAGRSRPAAAPEAPDVSPRWRSCVLRRNSREVAHARALLLRRPSYTSPSSEGLAASSDSDDQTMKRKAAAAAAQPPATKAGVVAKAGAAGKKPAVAPTTEGSDSDDPFGGIE